MKAKILCVDDETSVLQAQKRFLRKYFDIHLAESGKKALDILKKQGPFAVVVSDMKMPEMNGVTFLGEAKKINADTVRLMLTGDQDLKTAMEAVNEGHVFRFLTKPCPPETFARAIKAAVHQYQLIQAEKELLEKTLRQTIRVLVDLLALANPYAFSRASRVQRLIKRLTDILKLEKDLWMYESAAMLSQIGCLSIPENLLIKASEEKKLSVKEQRLCRDHPLVGYDQIAKIPRMENIALMIKYQQKAFDGSGFPLDDIQGDEIPLGSRLMKIALDFDQVKTKNSSSHEALEHIRGQCHLYDPQVLSALEQAVLTEKKYVQRELNIRQLNEGMILLDDILNSEGLLLACKDQEITETTVLRLIAFQKNSPVKEPVRVLTSPVQSL
jgi:response regulator RpfG family c-di-GMP phosphodiesterase